MQGDPPAKRTGERPDRDERDDESRKKHAGARNQSSGVGKCVGEKGWQEHHGARTQNREDAAEECPPKVDRHTKFISRVRYA